MLVLDISHAMGTKLKLRACVSSYADASPITHMYLTDRQYSLHLKAKRIILRMIYDAVLKRQDWHHTYCQKGRLSHVSQTVLL